MKCVEVGNIPNPVSGTCQTCKTKWEASQEELALNTVTRCRLCYSGEILFQPRTENGYVCIPQKNGPDHHYFNDEEIKIGIYRIWWGDSETPTSSLAAIIRDPAGRLWVAVTNWVCIIRIDALFTDRVVTRMKYLTDKIRNI